MVTRLRSQRTPADNPGLDLVGLEDLEINGRLNSQGDWTDAGVLTTLAHRNRGIAVGIDAAFPNSRSLKNNGSLVPFSAPVGAMGRQRDR